MKKWDNFFGSKLNSVLLIILICLMAVVLVYMKKNKEAYEENNYLFKNYCLKDLGTTDSQTGDKNDVYVYTNHGFSINLPRGYVPKEEDAEGGPYTIIYLPKGVLSYVRDVTFWEKWAKPDYTYRGKELIGSTTFEKYTTTDGKDFYWFKQGNVGYQFSSVDRKILETFKFVGWNQ